MQDLLASFTGSAVGLAGMIFLFGFAVFIHELGHFIAAKKLGVGVSAFAIGFGPKMIARKWGETEYSIRWLPLGGFVALKGMLAEGPESDEAGEDEKSGGGNPIQGQKSITEDVDALRNKPTWAKIVVFGAGVTMNFLTAIVIMFFFLWHGAPREMPRPNTLENVPEQSRIYEIGYRTGDRIVAVQGEAVSTWDEMEKAVDDWMKEQDSLFEAPPAMLTVERDGRRLRLPWPYPRPERPEGLTGLLRGWFLPYEMPDLEPYRAFHPPQPAYVAHVEPRSPAAKARLLEADIDWQAFRAQPAGERPEPVKLWDDTPKFPLQVRDQIVAINGEPVDTWKEMEVRLKANPNQLITIVVRRGEQYDRLWTVLEPRADDPSQGKLGIVSGLPKTDERDRMGPGEALATAVPATLRLTGRLIQMNVDFIGDNLGSKAGRRDIGKNLGGPILIARMAYQKARQGLSEYLMLFIVISIILAVMNLLPIPVLDGGYIVLALVEGIIRRPIPEKVLAPLLQTFMVLFTVFFVLIFYNDIRNWIGV